MPFSTPERRHRSISIVGAVLAAIVFALDLHQPPGLAVPVLYVVPVLLSLWQRGDRDTLLASGGCTVLTVAALVYWRAAPSFDAGLWNRAFTILVLWIVALMVLRFRRTDRAVVQITADYRQSDTLARRTDARLHSILDTAVDAIMVIDTRGIVQLANPAVERLFGYATDEVIGRNVSMLMPSPDHERHDGYLARYLATGEPHIIGIGREVTGRRKDGTTVPLSLAVSETHLDGVHTFTGILHDLTAVKQAEAALRARSELVKLGQMASIVAHEVRNPLAGIRGVLEVLQARATTPEADAAILRNLIERLDTLNQFVEDLLVFSRPKEPELRRTATSPFLEHLLDLLRHDPHFGQLAIEVDGPDLLVDLDTGLMERAILNVLQNAAQAMEGSGRIRIEVASEDGQCLITIADAGPGIPADVRDRLFDPFFTTRHGGTGLGLAITRRAIEQHHGTIAIASAPGAGTTVRIVLPGASTVNSRADTAGVG